ncbi:MAG: DUF4143 domain-containing protein [Myxococcota bacterium]
MAPQRGPAPRAIPETFHLELVGLLNRYLLVGGMPEAVARYASDDMTAVRAIPTIRTIQKAILDSYTLDFAKHAPAADIQKLSLVWNSLPSQLARENKRFLFSLIKEGARAREYENALTWLVNAGLIYRSSLVAAPKSPLKAFQDPRTFKVYACDVGLLGALADSPTELVSNDRSLLTEYHGAFIENYVAQHLVATMDASLHYWKNIGRASEVDFLIQRSHSILPLEVKSGVNVRSKSLAFYTGKYQPPCGLRTSMRNLRFDPPVLNIPLYAVQSLPALVAATSRRRW